MIIEAREDYVLIEDSVGDRVEFTRSAEGDKVFVEACGSIVVVEGSDIEVVKKFFNKPVP